MPSQSHYSFFARSLPGELQQWHTVAGTVLTKRFDIDNSTKLSEFATKVIKEPLSQSLVSLVAERLVAYVDEHPEWTRSGFANMIAANRSNMYRWQDGQMPSGDRLLMALLAVRSGLPDVGLSLNEAVYGIALRTLRRIRIDVLHEQATDLNRPLFQCVHYFVRHPMAIQLYSPKLRVEDTQVSVRVFGEIVAAVRQWTRTSDDSHDPDCLHKLERRARLAVNEWLETYLLFRVALHQVKWDFFDVDTFG